MKLQVSKLISLFWQLQASMDNCFPLPCDSLQRGGISSRMGTVQGYLVPFSRAATDTLGRSPMEHWETPVKSYLEVIVFHVYG